MPSTTIHFPDWILKKIYTRAREYGMSRNRYVLKACEAALDKEEGQWPADFFVSDTSGEDLELLREAFGEMERGIFSHRQNRRTPLL